jgi:predicted site-specific integrase-resolvase
MPITPNQSAEDYLAITEASRRVGVSTRTLLRWEERGLIEPMRLPDANGEPTGARRYKIADLDRLVGRPVASAEAVS